MEYKKQAVEWDPAWLLPAEYGDDPYDADEHRCPLCLSSDREDALLACECCDHAYHFDCLGLEDYPNAEAWFCMECQDQILVDHNSWAGHRRSRPHSRTRRQTAGDDPWRGAWGQFSATVYDALSIDLDYPDGDDDDLQWPRRTRLAQQRQQAQEQLTWQRRLEIARHAGAGYIFRNSMPPRVARTTATVPPPPPVDLEQDRKTAEEVRSWNAFEKAKADETDGNKRHKRKTSEEPSLTTESDHQQPERRLKRPRTRRIQPAHSNAIDSSSSNFSSSSSAITHALGDENRTSVPGLKETQAQMDTTPSFLTSLLQEIKTQPISDGDNVRGVSINGRTHYVESPASSPPPSGFSSPDFSSSPPVIDRPVSPILPLSSHIEANFPKANYPPAPYRQHSDSEAGPSRSKQSRLKISQVSPQRPSQEVPPERSMVLRAASSKLAAEGRSEFSRVRRAGSPVSLEVKEKINHIVRGALKPHWTSRQITSQQYEVINRDVSRKLYEEVAEPATDTLNEECKQRCESIATREVARAIAGLRV